MGSQKVCIVFLFLRFLSLRWLVRTYAWTIHFGGDKVLFFYSGLGWLKGEGTEVVYVLLGGRLRTAAATTTTCAGAGAAGCAPLPTPLPSFQHIRTAISLSGLRSMLLPFPSFSFRPSPVCPDQLDLDLDLDLDVDFLSHFPTMCSFK